MKIKGADYHSWRESTPIEINIDKEMAAFITKCIKEEAKRAINNDEFSKASEIIHAIDEMERIQDYVFDLELKRAEAEQDDEETEPAKSAEGTDA